MKSYEISIGDKKILVEVDGSGLQKRVFVLKIGEHQQVFSARAEKSGVLWLDLGHEQGQEETAFILSEQVFDQDKSQAIFSLRQGSRFKRSRVEIRPYLPIHLRKSEASAGQGAGKKKITSPMTGKILSLFFEVGSEVKKGETLLTVEAMKMENKILAPFDAKITSVKVKEGDQIKTGQELLTLVAG